MLLLLLPLPAVADGLSGSNGEVVKLGLGFMLPLVCSSDRRTAAVVCSFLLFLAAVMLVLGLAGDVASGTSFPLAVEAGAARSVTQPPPPSAAPLTVPSRRASIKSPDPSPSPPPPLLVLAKGELPLRGR